MTAAMPAETAGRLEKGASGAAQAFPREKTVCLFVHTLAPLSAVYYASECISVRVLFCTIFRNLLDFFNSLCYNIKW